MCKSQCDTLSIICICNDELTFRSRFGSTVDMVQIFKWKARLQGYKFDTKKKHPLQEPNI